MTRLSEIIEGMEIAKKPFIISVDEGLPYDSLPDALSDVRRYLRERSKNHIGNARSPYLQCAINPGGDCSNCDDFKQSPEIFVSRKSLSYTPTIFLDEAPSISSGSILRRY
jgi:Family of unknown function (DUF6464)